MAFKALYGAGIFRENGGECLWTSVWKNLWRGLWTKRLTYEVVMKIEFGIVELMIEEYIVASFYSGVLRSN